MVVNEENRQEKVPDFIIKQDNQYSVGCQTQVAKDCLQNGEFCDSEEEAQDWVEDECWIYSGEGWICLKCNEHLMGSLRMIRRIKGLDGNVKGPDEDEDLATGIETVR
ncbi:MAG: hypothetical protein O3A78_08530 [Nitrospinae bacterium]|jgi:hypothetical protein|nr:hypothetical protein [Nitrospinota bacterium]